MNQLLPHSAVASSPLSSYFSMRYSVTTCILRCLVSCIARIELKHISNVCMICPSTLLPLFALYQDEWLNSLSASRVAHRNEYNIMSRAGELLFILIIVAILILIVALNAA